METNAVNASMLANYNTIVCIDRSGSMGTKDMPNGKSRWEAAKEATGAIARKAAEYDTDGIDVGVFGGSTIKMYNNVTGTDEIINKIFSENEPASTTPTGRMLDEVLNKYFDEKAAGKNPKPILVAFITDGQPDDKDHVKRSIVSATQKMDKDEEIGISFLQIGNDADATAFLQELDDELVSKRGAKFDIVDTKKLNDVENVTEVLLAALND